MIVLPYKKEVIIDGNIGIDLWNFNFSFLGESILGIDPDSKKRWRANSPNTGSFACIKTNACILISLLQQLNRGKFYGWWQARVLVLPSFLFL